MSSALLSPLPPALRRSGGVLTMLKSVSLLKPSLNPEVLVQCSNFCAAHGPLRRISFFPVKSGRVSRPAFRFIPCAQASGAGRSVWDEAAEEFFRNKGRKPTPVKESREERGSGVREIPSGRASPAKTGRGDTKFGKREWEGGDSRVTENAGSRNSDFGSPSRKAGSQYSKAVRFAGREWGDNSGDRNGDEDFKGGEGSRATSARANAAPEWRLKKSSSGRDSGAPERRSSNNSRSSYSAGRGSSLKESNGYRNDRGGGYGGERRLGRERSVDDYEEGDENEMDSEGWPKREAINWRVEGEAVYGVAPIRAALLAERRIFHTLYVQKNLVENVETGKRKDKQAVSWILNRAHNLEIKVETVSKQHLNLLVDNRPHQGLVLDASPLELVPCEYLERPSIQDGRSPVWVALDEVIDPQNFGAILRSCHYLGATGVVVCAKNSAPLSGVVSKASAGALEVMEIQSCRNMMKFLDTSVLNGWRAVGASSEPRALPIQVLEPGLPTILVLGNEGRGLRTNVKRSCTELVSIKGFGATLASESPSSEQDVESDLNETQRFTSELQAAADAVDSLNVSVAAGILLHDLLSRSSQLSEPAVSAQ